MTLPHNNATARVTIDGLAICCFNRSENMWDVGYLHHDHVPLHTLILEIRDEAPVTIPDPTAQITFTTTNPQTPPYPGSPNGFFDPLGRRPDRGDFPMTADDVENFRWIIDLEDQSDVPHGMVTLRRPGFLVTRTFIHDAVFYTSKLSPNELYLAPNTNNTQDDPNNMGSAALHQHLFGRTNDEIAADIFCAPGNGAVTITIPGVLAQPRVLPHRPGNPWEIRLTNLCLHPTAGTRRFEIGDFHLFYDVLTITGQKQAIWGEPVVVRPLSNTAATTDRVSADLVSGRTDCDSTWLSTRQTLDPLFS
jgi:hypothetical protein